MPPVRFSTSVTCPSIMGSGFPDESRTPRSSHLPSATAMSSERQRILVRTSGCRDERYSRRAEELHAVDGDHLRAPLDRAVGVDDVAALRPQRAELLIVAIGPVRRRTQLPSATIARSSPAEHRSGGSSPQRLLSCASRRVAVPPRAVACSIARAGAQFSGRRYLPEYRRRAPRRTPVPSRASRASDRPRCQSASRCRCRRAGG